MCFLLYRQPFSCWEARSFVKTWCMNYKLSVMRSENQYYLMLFLGVLLMLFVGIGYFYTYI